MIGIVDELSSSGELKRIKSWLTGLKSIVKKPLHSNLQSEKCLSEIERHNSKAIMDFSQMEAIINEYNDTLEIVLSKESKQF